MCSLVYWKRRPSVVYIFYIANNSANFVTLFFCVFVCTVDVTVLFYRDCRCEVLSVYPFDWKLNWATNHCEDLNKWRKWCVIWSNLISWRDYTRLYIPHTPLLALHPLIASIRIYTHSFTQYPIHSHGAHLIISSLVIMHCLKTKKYLAQQSIQLTFLLNYYILDRCVSENGFLKFIVVLEVSAIVKLLNNIYMFIFNITFKVIMRQT